jgi:tripartite-type tricarboxylate transporter receptor subunit TctC
MYNRAKPDGLTVGNWVGALILQQALGQKGFEFDSRKFEWVGVPGPDYEACVLAKASGVTTIEEWMAAKKPLRLGGLAPGTSPSDIPRVLNAVLGLPLQVTDGYKGTSEIRLAVEAGELAGGCWAPDVIRNYWNNKLASRDVNIVLQANAKKHPQLQNVPNAIDYAKMTEDRLLIQVALHNTEDVLRSYSLPPGTPKDRVKVLQDAFMATMKDPVFLAEAQKANLIIDPLTGERVAKLVSEFFELQPNLLARLKKILTPK